jgi:DNA replication and repair protein RecF
MSLKTLKLRSFRNYSNLALDVSNGITVLTGKNGVGKTTILEAICLLGSGRSFRSAKNIDFIRRGEEFSVIKAEIEANSLSSSLEVRIYPQGKKVFVDEKMAKSTEELLKRLPSIVFSPADHNIIDGDSSERKFFLNRAASLLDWEYPSLLSEYNKSLLQRNRLLKQAFEESWNNSKLLDQIGVWDEQMLHYGSQLMWMRCEYLHALQPIVKEEYKKISQLEDEFCLTYQPMDDDQLMEMKKNNAEDWRQFFSKKLKDSLRRDMATGTTHVGPHKDEILLTLNGNKVKFYGSQGEKRTCALALRLGELALFRLRTNRLPILLFDDVSSELDRSRRKSLVNLLRQEKAQVLITATELPSSLMEEAEKSFEHLDLGEHIHVSL